MTKLEAQTKQLYTHRALLPSQLEHVGSYTYIYPLMELIYYVACASGPVCNLAHTGAETKPDHMQLAKHVLEHAHSDHDIMKLIKLLSFKLLE